MSLRHRKLKRERYYYHRPGPNGEPPQSFVDEMARHCIAAERPCEGCMSGGMCDGPSDAYEDWLDRQNDFDDIGQL